MKTYQDKTDLITAINNSFRKYIAEFDEIPETLQDRHVEGVGRTPSQNLSYQLGWIHLLLDWDAKERRGIKVHTPAEGYKWNNLGGLYQSFYDTYGKMSLHEQKTSLQRQVEELCAWIDTLQEQELFEPGQRRWATNAAQWPIYKWVHINTVAPFTTFRTAIRKWKKGLGKPADEVDTDRGTGLPYPIRRTYRILITLYRISYDVSVHLSLPQQP